MSNWNELSKKALKKSFSNGNGFGSIMNIASGLTNVIGASVSNSELQNVDTYQNNIDDYNNAVFSTDNYISLISDYQSNIAPDKVNKSDLQKSTGEQFGNTLGAIASGASAGSVGGPWGAVIGAGVGLLSGIFGSVASGIKAQREADLLNNKLAYAKSNNAFKFNTSAGTINDNMFNAAALNYRAYGGDLYDNAMIMKHYNGGKVKHRKTSYIGNLFAYGGQMKLGGDWSNGVTIIGEGGTHEINPYEGVQVGIDEQGIPNLVEEGEVIFNDYVYSNRLKPTAKQLDEVKLCPSFEGDTFAEIAKKISEESQERPNDPISKNGLIDGMMKLEAIQEEIREKKARQQFMREFKKLPQEQQEAIVAERAAQAMQQEETIQPDFDFGARYAPNGNPSEQLGEEYGFANGGNLFATGSWLPILSNEFQYYNNNAYDEGYLNWLNSYDIEGSKYWGALSKLYSDTFKGKELTKQKAIKLGQDKKFGHFHKALGEAYSDYLNTKSAEPTNNIDRPKLEKIVPTGDMLNNRVVYNQKIKPTNQTELEDNDYSDWLRYMPAVGSGIQMIADLFGANNPDYSKAEMIGDAKNRIRNIRAPQLYNYLRFNPYDVNYQQNKMQNVGLGAQRNILNTSSGNRAAALAALLVGNNNTLGSMGDLYRTALEYNDNQRKVVSDFNRNTDQINLQSILTAEQANQNMDLQRANLTMQQAKMMDDIDTASSAAISANRNNFFKNLGNIGNDNYYKNQTDWLINSGWVSDNTQTRKYPRKNGGKVHKSKRMI